MQLRDALSDLGRDAGSGASATSVSASRAIDCGADEPSSRREHCSIEAVGLAGDARAIRLEAVRWIC